jgi:hypothetical protein
MRGFKPKSHRLAEGAPFSMSGAGSALIVISLLSAHTAGPLVTASVLLTAYLACRVAGVALHRGVPLPSGPCAGTDTIEAHVERVSESKRGFGTTLRKPCDPTI